MLTLKSCKAAASVRIAEWSLIDVDTMCPGLTAPTVDQQLSACSREMKVLLAGMANAVSSVTELTLQVNHRHSQLCQDSAVEKLATSRKQQQQQQDSYEEDSEEKDSEEKDSEEEGSDGEEEDSEEEVPDEEVSDEEEDSEEAHEARIAMDLDEHGDPCIGMGTHCPHGFGAVSGGVFAMLAAALPVLKKLKLYGHCWNPALPTFGAACPLLADLTVDLLRVPIDALRGLAQHLPAITSITLASWGLDIWEGDRDRAALQAYVDAALLEVKPCVKLAVLRIDLPDTVTLTCPSTLWEQLPMTLRHFECQCKVTRSSGFTRLTGRVPSLTVAEPPFLDLHTLLRNSPPLERLEVITNNTDEWDTITLACSRAEDLPWGQICPLKQRLLARHFSLKCFDLCLSGTVQEVQEVLSWLPRFADVHSITVVFRGGTMAPCLGRLPHLFGGVGLDEIRLEGHVDQSDLPDMDAGFFAPLAGMAELSSLDLSCVGMTLTVPGLVQLCMTLPDLEELTGPLSEGFIRSEVRSALLDLGRKISVYST